MADNVVELRHGARKDSALKRHPGSIGLAAVVEMLTRAPLDAYPGLRKVSSVIMTLDEIIENDGEVFVISHDPMVAGAAPDRG